MDLGISKQTAPLVVSSISGGRIVFLFFFKGACDFLLEVGEGVRSFVRSGGRGRFAALPGSPEGG